MIKKTLILFSILSIISCQPRDAANADMHHGFIIKKKRFDSILDEILKVTYPTYSSNDLIEAKAIKELSSRIDSAGKLNLFNEFPLEVLRVRKNPNGKGAIVHLYVDMPYKSNQALLSNSTGFDIIGLMDEKRAESIDDKSVYLIKGKYKKSLTELEKSALTAQTMFSTNVSFLKHSDDDITINLGVFLYEIDSLQKIGSK